MTLKLDLTRFDLPSRSPNQRFDPALRLETTRHFRNVNSRKCVCQNVLGCSRLHHNQVPSLDSSYDHGGMLRLFLLRPNHSFGPEVGGHTAGSCGTLSAMTSASYPGMCTFPPPGAPTAFQRQTQPFPASFIRPLTRPVVMRHARNPSVIRRNDADR